MGILNIPIYESSHLVVQEWQGAITDSELGLTRGSHPLLSCFGGRGWYPLHSILPSNPEQPVRFRTGGRVVHCTNLQGKGSKCSPFFVFSLSKPSGVKSAVRRQISLWAQNWPSGVKSAFGHKTSLRASKEAFGHKNGLRASNRPSGFKPTTWTSQETGLRA